MKNTKPALHEESSAPDCPHQVFPEQCSARKRETTLQLAIRLAVQKTGLKTSSTVSNQKKPAASNGRAGSSS